MCYVPPVTASVLQNIFQQTGWNMLGNAAFRIASPKEAAAYGVISSCAQSALPIAAQAFTEAVLKPSAVEAILAPHAGSFTVQLSLGVLNRLASAQIAVATVNCFKGKGEQKLSMLNGLYMEAARFGIEYAVKASV